MPKQLSRNTRLLLKVSQCSVHVSQHYNELKEATRVHVFMSRMWQTRSSVLRFLILVFAVDTFPCFSPLCRVLPPPWMCQILSCGCCHTNYSQLLDFCTRAHTTAPLWRIVFICHSAFLGITREKRGKGRTFETWMNFSRNSFQSKVTDSLYLLRKPFVKGLIFCGSVCYANPNIRLLSISA